MNTDLSEDLAACRHWQKAVSFGDMQLGIVPRLNAVTALNEAAAVLWDLLVDVQDPAEILKHYRALRPDRQENAEADLDHCLQAWRSQGLLDPPEPEDDPGDVLDPPAEAPIWATTITIGGQHLRLEVDDAQLAASIKDLVAPFPRSSAPPDAILRGARQTDIWVLYKDGAYLRSADTRFDLRTLFLNELGRCAGGEAEWHAIAHGASLEKKGVGVFLAGPSGSGKSTLSAFLVHQGWRLLAEDSTAFDADLKVQSLPFSLSIKSGSVDYLSQFFPDLLTAREHKLGARLVRYQPLKPTQIAPEALRLNLLLSVRFDPTLDREACQVSELAPHERLELLFNNQSYVNFEAINQRPFFDFLEHCPAYGIRYGSCDAAEHAITRLVKKSGILGP